MICVHCGCTDDRACRREGGEGVIACSWAEAGRCTACPDVPGWEHPPVETSPTFEAMLDNIDLATALISVGRQKTPTRALDAGVYEQLVELGAVDSFRPGAIAATDYAPTPFGTKLLEALGTATAGA